MISWDLTHLFETKEAWEKEVETLKKQVQKVEPIFLSCNNIKELEIGFKEKIKMEQMLESIYCYPKRLLDLNYENEEAKEMFSTAFSLYQEIEAIQEKIKNFLLEHSSLTRQFMSHYPYYKRYCEWIIQYQFHSVKNQEAYRETQRNLEMLKDFYRIITRQELTFGEIIESGEEQKITSAMLSKWAISSKREERKRAFLTTMTAYETFSNMLAAIYEYKIKVENTLAQSKQFHSQLEELLFENMLPKTLISNFISAIHNHLPIEHEWIALKKMRLGVEEYHIYDMQASNTDSYFNKISLEEAKNMIEQSIWMLGKEYQKRLETGFLEGWIDTTVCDNKRKDSFSCITYSGVPYTMLQYKEDMESLRILAHETGHMIHTSYAKENQYEYFEYSLFLAEIASKVHEVLLFDYLLKHNKREEATNDILEKMLTSFCNSLFSQAMLTEFEIEVHKKVEQGEKISANYLKNLYFTLAQTYYGSSFTCDELLGMNFGKITHFYLYPSYYVWQYGVGISIAIKIANDLIDDKNDMRNKYIEFLKIGNRLSVIESLKTIGIDLEEEQYMEEALMFIKKNMKILKKEIL